MKIRPSLVAVTAVVSLVLFAAPTAGAQEKKVDTPVAENAPVKVVIQSGDTLTSVADAHSTTYVRIFNANDSISNPDIIDVDDEVRIPTAEEQLPDRFAEFNAQQAAAAAATTAVAAAAVPVEAPAEAPVAAPVATQPVAAPAAAPAQAVPSYAAAPRPVTASSAGNTYYAGYCTWYAKERRPDLPNMLGNGGQWVANAAAQGYATGSTPRVGAIAEMPGHVAYVEAVNGDGTIVISEMNGWAGFGNVGSRTTPASMYQYIY